MTATPPPLSEPNSGPRLPIPGRGLEMSAMLCGGSLQGHVWGFCGGDVWRGNGEQTEKAESGRVSIRSELEDEREKEGKKMEG